MIEGSRVLYFVTKSSIYPLSFFVIVYIRLTLAGKNFYFKKFEMMRGRYQNSWPVYSFLALIWCSTIAEEEKINR